MEVPSHADDKSDQIRQGKNELVLDIWRDHKELFTIEQVAETGRAAVEKSKKVHKGRRVFLAQLRVCC